MKSWMQVWFTSVAVLCGASGCEHPATLPPWTVHYGDLSETLTLATNDFLDELRKLVSEGARTGPLPLPRCTPGRVNIELRTPGGEPPALPASIATEQGYVIVEERCGTFGHRVVVWGRSERSMQWAMYDLLRILGVRYFHPEQAYYPPKPAWPRAPIHKAAEPSFWRRSFNVHRTHPVELSAPLNVGDLPMADFQRRWIDWNVRQRSTHISGFDGEFVGLYPWVRGFDRDVGINLLNTQQGFRPVLDPDDPRTEEEQMAEAIEQQMEPVEGAPTPEHFGFQFNPSEFTEASDIDTVRRLTFIANYMADHYPLTWVSAINHGTHGEPTEHYGVRFFDLPQFAPPNLGVRVHTLMFYDLERPAPVYGNEDFSYLLTWAREQAEMRRIIHYPESSWWLTFDLPVPLFLAPVTLEARQHDIDLLRDLLSPSPRSQTGIYGHHTFTSGQEWGYWLVDWCITEMTFDVSHTYNDCLRQFTDIFTHGEQVYTIWKAMEARQMDDMRDPERIRFLVGSDDETEVALAAGIHFHPLPPAPEDVLQYSDADVTSLRQDSLEPLRDMADDYFEWSYHLGQLVELQDEAQASWLREVWHGALVFALRAEHARVVYSTALALRKALAKRDLEAINDAYAGVELARALTDEARSIVRQREAEYRYPPQLTIVGGEPGTPEAVPNKTIYPYRYLSRTHRMFYWERPDNQLARLFGEGLELVQVNDRILREGRALQLDVLADNIDSLLVQYGDGASATDLQPYVYGSQDLFSWSLNASTGDGAIHHEDQAMVVSRKFIFGKGSLMVQEPGAAALINGLLPGLVIGTGSNEAGSFMGLGRLDGPGSVPVRGSLVLRLRSGWVSGPADLNIDLGAAIGVVMVYGAVLSVDDSVYPRVLSIEGELDPHQVVELLVSVGGFDVTGATELVAGVLGYTPSTLPDRIEFFIEASGWEESD